MPMTPFIGVRISWLMLARKSDFSREASSASSLASDIAASAPASAVTSARVPTHPPISPWLSRSDREVTRAIRDGKPGGLTTNRRESSARPVPGAHISGAELLGWSAPMIVSHGRPRA